MKYLRNAWYCAGWEQDLTDEPRGIKMLGQQMLILRTNDGVIHAMDGACPHRFAPLYKGRVENGIVQCPYHGLEFNTEGKCVHNPHSDVIPDKAALKKYPVAVRNLAIWVWMGDPEKADESLLVEEMEWAQSSEYATGYGYTYVNANYQLVIDNLLDLTHAPFMHTMSFGGVPPEFGKKSPVKREFKVDGRRIHSNYFLGERDTIGLFKPFFPHDRCQQFSFMTLHQPTNLTFEISIIEAGEEDRHSGLQIPSFHFITPEDEKTAHYFYASGRNTHIDDEQVTTMMMAGVKMAFQNEDEPMIRSIQDIMGTPDLFSLSPAILASDAAGVAARRSLDKMIAEEELEPLSIK
ncbi:MAG: aromatic ring-hydroxylating dioxygenase subunit alpha [Cellvibrionaceae bacterium]|nr:aromatic ring-hydroxylating dioxygenase subunit alpha [Cellvibrionaceae bacterium]